jgi:hypothetical protein
MSHRSIGIALLGGMTLMLGSCTERTAAGPDTPAEFGTAPSSPGQSGIFRFQDTYIDAIGDGKAGLIAVIGIVSSIQDFCGGLNNVNLAEFQLKPHQLGEVTALITMRNATIQVLALPAVSQGDFCLDFAGQPVLYRGTGSVVRNDNNFTPTGTDGGRADAFGLSASGRLTDLVHGGTVQFSGDYRLLITPDDAFRELVSRVTISR